MMAVLLLDLYIVPETAPGACAVLSFDYVLYFVGDVAEEVYACEPLEEINRADLGLALALYVLEKQAYAFVGIVLQAQQCHEIVVGYGGAAAYSAVFTLSDCTALYNI